MKHLRTILKALGILTLVPASFGAYFSCVENIPNQYSETYYAELIDKYDLLKNEENKKIVFIGGSSLPFGLRSDLIEEEFDDYKIIDFGLYGTLGTKLMMDLSREFISEDDIVILSPEIDRQAYSLYFNPEATLMATDGADEMLNCLSFIDKVDLMYSYGSFSRDKLSYYFNNNSPNPDGIYRRDSFNEYGDIKVDRPSNIMNNGYDSSNPISITKDLLDSEFVQYVNKYSEDVHSKHAKIYFNYSCVNELSITSSKTLRDEFELEVNRQISFDVLNPLQDSIMDYRYFYDTNFHLNSTGAICYTKTIINGLKNKLGIPVVKDNEDNPTQEDFDMPKPPEIIHPVIDEEEIINADFTSYKGEDNNQFDSYFEYILVGDSYQISGIKDLYINIEEVILPTVHEGKAVTSLNTDALYGCINLKTIHIGNSYRNLQEKCFNGCISLQYIRIYQTDPNYIIPSNANLLDGCNRDVKICVPRDKGYTIGYTWEHYRDYFLYIDL